MADVVEQRRHRHVARHDRLELERPRHPPRDVEGAERVAEARVLGARIDQPGEAHLVQAAQPLEGAGLEHPAELAVLAAQLDEAVHRVAEHAVLHPRSIAAAGALLALLAPAACDDERIALDTDAACEVTDCRVAADYGEIGAVSGAAQEIQDALVWFGRIGDECGARVVELSIELVEGRGSFLVGVGPGTYPLTGEELDPDTCGVCVRLIVDDGRCYFAAAGTVVLTSTEIDLAGTLTDAAFAPVDCIDGDPIAGECASEIGAMSFNERIGDEPD
jgi:hypothetical protein